MHKLYVAQRRQNGSALVPKNRMSIVGEFGMLLTSDFNSDIILMVTKIRRIVKCYGFFLHKRIFFLPKAVSRDFLFQINCTVEQFGQFTIPTKYLGKFRLKTVTAGSVTAVKGEVQ